MRDRKWRPAERDVERSSPRRGPVELDRDDAPHSQLPQESQGSNRIIPCVHDPDSGALSDAIMERPCSLVLFGGHDDGNGNDAISCQPASHRVPGPSVGRDEHGATPLAQHRVQSLAAFNRGHGRKRLGALESEGFRETVRVPDERPEDVQFLGKKGPRTAKEAKISANGGALPGQCAGERRTEKCWAVADPWLRAIARPGIRQLSKSRALVVQLAQRT